MDWRGYLLPAGVSHRVDGPISQIYHPRWCQDLPNLTNLSDDNHVRLSLRGKLILVISSRKVNIVDIESPARSLTCEPLGFNHCRINQSSNGLGKPHARPEQGMSKLYHRLRKLEILLETTTTSLSIRTRLGSLMECVQPGGTVSIRSGYNSVSSLAARHFR